MCWNVSSRLDLGKHSDRLPGLWRPRPPVRASPTTCLRGSELGHVWVRDVRVVTNSYIAIKNAFGEA